MHKTAINKIKNEHDKLGCFIDNDGNGVYYLKSPDEQYYILKFDRKDYSFKSSSLDMMEEHVKELRTKHVRIEHGHPTNPNVVRNINDILENIFYEKLKTDPSEKNMAEWARKQQDKLDKERHERLLYAMEDELELERIEYIVEDQIFQFELEHGTRDSAEVKNDSVHTRREAWEAKQPENQISKEDRQIDFEYPF